MEPATLPVVVGHDGSPAADIALEWAAEEARRTATGLRVVVVAARPEHLSRQARSFEQEWARTTVAAVRASAAALDLARTSVVVQLGHPVATLLRATAEARLLVAGSRGHGPAEGEWLGSVGHHVARHASCPVAVVRQHDPRSRQLVVGIDGSPSSVRALHTAAARANQTGENVLAVHVYGCPSGARDGLAIDPIDVDSASVDAAERMAAGLIVGVTVDFPDVAVRSTAVVGRPDRVLSRLSETASLVVVGSRGRNPLREILLGSVSQRVLEHAACTVLVVR